VDTIQQAYKIVRDAEASLRKLIEQAFGEQRYMDLAAIAPLADAVAKLARGGISEKVSSLPASESAPTQAKDAREGSVKATSKKTYPHFLRVDDKLVKIGWSKKTKAEYEHRAPIEVADALVASIRAKSRDGQKFAATDVIPVQMGEDPAPDYQVYLALKWLHSEGIVTKYGRDRYAIEPGRIGAEGLKPYLSRLPTYKTGVSA
jgi:hypothetical protein